VEILEKIKYHNILANYFTDKCLYLDALTQKQPDIRKLVEQPWQQTYSKQWHKLESITLGYFPFVMAKVKAELLNNLIKDYQIAYQSIPSELRENIRYWESFFNEKLHILRRGDEKWPAYKIILQLAVEHSDDSPVTRSAEQWLAQGNCGWYWLRRNQRVQNVQINPCIAVFEGHTGWIEGALETKDGNFLSWSEDDTLRIWDSLGNPVALLKGHTHSIKCAFETRERNFISWSIEENDLRLWGSSGITIALMEGHTGPIMGVRETSEGNFISWSVDKTIRLWGSSGTPYCFDGRTYWINYGR
jgi:WD40 repeat protein